MVTIKSFTDFEQSKKLAEILPLESADITVIGKDNIIVTPYLDAKKSLLACTVKEDSLHPCWSLVALLEVLKPHCERLETHLRADKKYNLFAVKGDFAFRSFDECSEGFDNLVDAYYELILKFKAQKIL